MTLFISRVVPALCLVLFFGTPFFHTKAWSAEAPQHRAGRRSPIVQAVERAAPAVVNISTLQILRRTNPFSRFQNPLMEDFFRDFFRGRPQRRKERSLGSGVIIRPDGYILTNEHVISRASEIRVSLSGNRTFPARVVGSDPANDLAIIKIKADEPLPYLPLGRSDDLMIGETIIAIGNPFGLQHTVTTGVVSALNRSIDSGRRTQGRHPSDFIQTDASINPGNSGGPLLNIYGELIGINTAIFSRAQGIGFSIPINRARRILKDLIDFGKVRKTWVGLVLQDLTPQITTNIGFPGRGGTIATQVIEGSPAAGAGIRRGDVLLEFGKKEIYSREDYLNELAGYTVGSQVQIRLWRKGKTLSRSIQLAPVPTKMADAIARNWLGIDITHINPDNVKRYHLRTRIGVLVTSVLDGSPADAIGILPGDIIRMINGQNTDDLESFREVLVRAREFPRVQLLVQRRGDGYNVTLKP